MCTGRSSWGFVHTTVTRARHRLASEACGDYHVRAMDRDSEQEDGRGLDTESDVTPIEPGRKGAEKFRFRVRRFAAATRYADLLTTRLRVAHLTDMHVGLVTPMKVQHEAINIVNRERPDLVVLTGDFVCHTHAWLDDLTDVLSRLEVPAFAVLGNHDYWAGAQGVRMALKRANVELLSNANTLVTLRGERLQLVGLDDAYTGHADRKKALRGLDPTIATLGLSHIAEEADALWEGGVPFVLSGHTHAGQLTVARLHELTIGKLAGHRYVHGLYGERRAKGAVYVSAGVGAAVMPLRFGDRGSREVALFELGARPGDLEHAEHHDEQPALRPASDEPHDLAQARAHARFQARRKKLFRPPRA